MNCTETESERVRTHSCDANGVVELAHADADEGRREKQQDERLLELEQKIPKITNCEDVATIVSGDEPGRGTSSTAAPPR